MSTPPRLVVVAGLIWLTPDRLLVQRRPLDKPHGGGCLELPGGKVEPGEAPRAAAPVEYAGGAADFAKGIPANTEWNVKVFLDASSVSAGGYNLYLFYP